MGDFARYSICAGRKPHRCLFCEGTIDKGERHLSLVSFDLGRFTGGRLHQSCWKAEFHLRVVICEDDGDEMTSIHDAEVEDLEILASEVPDFRRHADRIISARAERRAA